MARGRDAIHPLQIPLRGWKDIVVRTATKVISDNLGLIAAGVAFYALLALFPAITALVAVAGLLTDPVTIAEQMELMATAIPKEASSIILNQIYDVAESGQTELGVAALIGLSIAFISASRGMDSIIRGLNVAYDETEKRSFFRLALTVLTLTLVMIVGLVISLTVVAAIPAVLAFLGGWPLIYEIMLFLRWPLLFLIGVAGFSTLYRFGPDRRNARWRWLTPGGLVACVLWVAASFGFTYYVRNFASYNETFGALGGVIILLMWLWISAFIALLGAALDGEIEAQTRKDSTVGPDRPMGQRGAVKADTLGRITG